MAQPWGLVIILLMKKCQRPGFTLNKVYRSHGAAGEKD